VSDQSQRDEHEKYEYVGNKTQFKVLVKCNIPNTSKDEILNVLRNYTNPLEIKNPPRSFKTAVGKYPPFKVTNFESVDQELGSKPSFVYMGIRSAMERGMAKFNAEGSHLDLKLCSMLMV